MDFVIIFITSVIYWRFDVRFNQKLLLWFFKSNNMFWLISYIIHCLYCQHLYGLSGARRLFCVLRRKPCTMLRISSTSTWMRHQRYKDDRYWHVLLCSWCNQSRMIFMAVRFAYFMFLCFYRSGEMKRTRDMAYGKQFAGL